MADAEDVLRDTWLKWSSVDAGRLDQPRAYLARTVTNLSINRLKSATARRESYAGPWLPAPLVMADDAGRQAEQAEAISLAMLVVLETLSPLERAVFVLKDVFGFSFGEIAAMLDRSEAPIPAWPPSRNDMKSHFDVVPTLWNPGFMPFRSAHGRRPAVLAMPA